MIYIHIITLSSERGTAKKQKHKVELTPEERQTLQTLVRKGQHSALKLTRAHILLKSDVKGPGWTDAQIAEAFGCHERTVSNVRKRFIERGRLESLDRQKQSRPSRAPKRWSRRGTF